MSAFSAEQFRRFCARLKIDSKESGQIPLSWIGTQRYFVEEVAKGLQAGIHTFTVLKGRQLGISTASLALDLFWMFCHRGLQGALVTDTEANKILFKSYLAQYLASLPAGARVPVVEHNREQLILKNRSRLAYIVAGKRKNESLGAGKAVNFMHATEVASWGDQEGLGSLMATLAQQNPNRLYIFESTAFGYNMWYEMWEKAKAADTVKAIFIGWWRNEFYRKEKGSIEYKTYWDGTPTPEEREWMREVYELYHYNVTDEQLAWWRWYMAEQSPDLNSMLQAFPPTESYAFQMSGSKFFSGERVNVAYKKTLAHKPTFHRYRFGTHFEQTQFTECDEYSADAMIWEMPDPRGVYVLGADPAYGSSEWADKFVISVWRCFADKVVQVAEVATPDWTEAQFAWAMAHLGGSYRPCMVNLELNGPGYTVLNELQNLKKYTGPPSVEDKDLYNAVGQIRDYLWRKNDRIGGMASAIQFKSTTSEKLRLLTNLRDYFERDMVEVRSTACAEEFRNVSREGDRISGEGRAKDDRVIAAALAVLAWDNWIMHEMIAERRYYEIEMRPPGEPRITPPLENAVMKFLERNGIRGVGNAR